MSRVARCVPVCFAGEAPWPLLPSRLPSLSSPSPVACGDQVTLGEVLPEANPSWTRPSHGERSTDGRFGFIGWVHVSKSFSTSDHMRGQTV